jgi:hypothetical protein
VANGQVVAVTITNPGLNYTSAPAVASAEEAEAGR